MKKLLLVFLLMFASPAFATGISGASAPCDNATLSKYNGTADIEINWEPNTINLNWYDGDTKLTVQSSAQSCVYDSTLTVPEQPTKLGYTFNGWKVIHVPGGYTELEYLESTGTQYVDTGISNWDNTIEFETKLSIEAQTGSVNTFFGAWDIWGTGGHVIPAICYYNSSYDVNQSFQAGSHKPVGVDIGIRNGQTGIYSFKGNNISWSNGTSLVFDRGANFNVSDTNIFLFACNTGGSAREYAKFKMYYFKFWLDNMLVRNFIPARRDSDGVLGMYDTVTDTFFTNAGTGSFVAGPVVQ